MIYNISPATQLPSARTLHRDLAQQFKHHRHILKSKLNAHIRSGGLILLTTDGWAASNLTDFQAITASWTDENWKRRDTMLDIVHVKEPIHSGKYLAELLLGVTNDFGITGSVFTITQDNASNNTVMLKLFEAAAAAGSDWTVEQPWTFTVKEGDVRCMAHIIHLAVQAALKALKAVPAEDWTVYRCEDGEARITLDAMRGGSVTSSLEKLRRHIYVFRDRRAWRVALQRQTTAAGLRY